MERVSEVLQFPIIINRRGTFSVESQILQKLYFFLSRSTAEGAVLKEFLELQLDLWLVRSLIRLLIVSPMSSDTLGPLSEIPRKLMRLFRAHRLSQLRDLSVANSTSGPEFLSLLSLIPS